MEMRAVMICHDIRRSLSIFLVLVVSIAVFEEHPESLGVAAPSMVEYTNKQTKNMFKVKIRKYRQIGAEEK